MSKIQDELLLMQPQEGMQYELCRTPATEVLLGGQAGPGKTWALMYEDLEDLLTTKYMRTLMLRRTSPQLAHMIEEAVEMYRPFGAIIRMQDSMYRGKTTVTFPEFDSNFTDIGREGGKIIFGHMEHEGDKHDYQGMEYHRVKFDELTHFLESQYLYLFSRVRSKVREKDRYFPGTMRGSANPDGPGLLWVKRRFIDKLKPMEIKWFKRVGDVDTEVPRGTPNAISRQFIPGERSANAYIGPDYEAALAQLDEASYRALALGSWEIKPGDRQLIDLAWVDWAISGEVKPEGEHKAVGADFATYVGRDKQSIVTGIGNSITDVGLHCGLHDHEFAWEVYTACMPEMDLVSVSIDSNGPGSGAANHLAFGSVVTIGGVERRITPLPHLHRCTHKDPRYDEKWLGAIQFNSFRSQAYWKFRDDLINKRIDLSWFRSRPDMRDMFLEECQSVDYVRKGGKLWISSKDDIRKADKLGRSPDLLDGVIYWNWARELKIERAATLADWEAELDNVDSHSRMAREIAESADESIFVF